MKREGDRRVALPRWSAVVRRVCAVVLVAAVGAGCAGDRGSSEEARTGTVEIDPEPGSVGVSFGAGERLYSPPGAARRLGGPLSDRLLGALAPLLVPDPAGGSLLAYQSWSGDEPVLRVHDGESGRDRVLADGALSVAWGRRGIAYVLAVDGASERILGHVVVRPELRGPEHRWTPAPGRYVVAAWAGRRLLVYRLRRGWPDLLALEGPGRSRRLAPAAALVAVSPNGRHAFLARHGASPPVVRVVDVATGRELVRLSVPELRWIADSGSWSNDRVAAATSDGIAVFDVGAGRLEVEQFLRFPSEQFQLAGLEPRLDGSAERVSAWASLTPRPREAVGSAVVVDCDRFTLRCARSAPFPESPGPRLVYNPSRP